MFWVGDISFTPSWCWFVSPLDFQFLWWPQRCLAPQVLHAWKGCFNQRSWSIYACVHRYTRRCLSEPNTSLIHSLFFLQSTTVSEKSFDVKCSSCFLSSFFFFMWLFLFSVPSQHWDIFVSLVSSLQTCIMTLIKLKAHCICASIDKHKKLYNWDVYASTSRIHL